MSASSLEIDRSQSFTLAILFGLGSFVRLVYSCLVGLRIGRRQVAFSDRLWYGVVPIIGYAAMMMAALMVSVRLPSSLEVLALALVLLLVAGVRNAWDLILFIVAQRKGPV